MIVEDNNKIDKLMNGKEYAVGEFAHTLRANIFSEHFGLNYEEVQDPLNLDFLKKIEQNSKVK